MNPIIQFVCLNDILTKILIYRNEDDSKIYKSQNKKFCYKRLILVIPGNPGEIEYYHEFLSQIHSETNLPVIGISHSGHNRIPGNLFKPEMPRVDSSLFGLDAQLMNKAKFIHDFIEPSTKIILVAHSIGCYCTLELLNRFKDINKMVDHAILIFPTIDSMIQTQSGRITNFIFQYFYYPIMTLAHCLEFLLSQNVKEKLIETFFKWNGNKNASKFVIKSATNLINPYCLKATIVMLLDEFRLIQRPKLSIIKSNASKLSLFYGEADHWSPSEYYYYIREKLQDFEDSLDLQLCLGQIGHAFVMEPQWVDIVSKLSLKIIQKKWNL